MHRLPLSILGDGPDDLRRPQTLHPKLSACHRDFCERGKGHSALQLSRDLDCQYKTAFVLAHKLREALGTVVQSGPELTGEVQVDGMYTGGHRKPENKKAERVDRRLAEEQTGKRQVVVVAREVMGRTLPFVVPRESAAIPLIRQHVASGTIIHADEARGWDLLHASYDTRRVNHSVEYVADDGANVNQAKAGSAAFEEPSTASITG